MDYLAQSEMATEFALIFTLMVPLLAAFIASIARKPIARELGVLFVSIALFVNVLNLLALAHNGLLERLELATIAPGLTIALSLEPIGLIFALVASFLWVITTLYSIGYMRGNNERHQDRFYCFFGIALFATMGIAMAGNLLTLFIFYEILTLSTYPLVTHKGNAAAKHGGRVYLGILLATSIGLFLPGIVWIWYETGTTEFVSGGIIRGAFSPEMTGALLVLLAYGVGKAALMPFHRWLPAAMVAPTPVSALLHAVAVVKAGVFAILKIVLYIIGPSHLINVMESGFFAGEWLIYVSGTTIVLASVTALRQDNLKRMLAYSTVSQLSYVVMAAAIATPAALMGAAFHIAAHAFGKITLFFAAGAIYTNTKKTEISQLDGIGKKMPITMAAFTLGALSMIGLPPLAGFLSKYYILAGSFQRGLDFPILVVIASTLLNAAYFLPIIYRAFFRMRDRRIVYDEAPWPILVAISISALGALALFLKPDLVLWLASIVIGGNYG